MKQRKKSFIPFILGAALILGGCTSSTQQSGNAIPTQDVVSQDTFVKKENSIQDLIKRKFSQDLQHTPILQENTITQSVTTLADFYNRQSWLPVWFKQDGAPLPSIAAFLEIIEKADEEGLSPRDYHLDKIKSLVSPPEKLPQETIADLDILLTDAYHSYASHLRWGKTGYGKEFTLASTAIQSLFLENIPAGPQFQEAVASFAPPYPEYAKLKQLLARYRQLEADGGWPVISAQKLTKGNRGPLVESLKTRLHITGELEQINPEHHDYFDADLEKAVRLFQKNQNLQEDGAAGAETLRAMNVPVAERIRQIRMDMERWRWMPRDETRYIVANIPDFSMRVVEDGQTVIQMKTIVGRIKNPTPLFSERMSIVELNPTWNIPVSIIRTDIVPETKKDPSYMSRKKIRIYHWNSSSTEISPDSIDWDTVNPQKFPYRLVQDSGAHNSLGRIKFLFPNAHEVYMHDTPSRSLFNRKERTFSAGCIRLERPFDLAGYLFKDDPKWDQKEIQKVINTGKRTRINLENPLPVYITYFTVGIDDSGNVSFRRDIYDHDRSLEKEMNNRKVEVKNL